MHRHAQQRERLEPAQVGQPRDRLALGDGEGAEGGEALDPDGQLAGQRRPLGGGRLQLDRQRREGAQLGHPLRQRVDRAAVQPQGHEPVKAPQAGAREEGKVRRSISHFCIFSS